MKRRAFAQWAGVGYRTAWNWRKSGQIKGSQTESGTIVIPEEMNQQPGKEVIRVVYARVSANENRPNLDAQADRLCASCEAKGEKVHKVVKEVGSGMNESRRKLLAILADPTGTVVVVEHKDRLTRFGFTYIETLMAVQGRSLEVVNTNEHVIEGLMADLISIMYSCAARLSGQRRAKRKTENIVQELALAQEQKQGEAEPKQHAEEGA